MPPYRDYSRGCRQIGKDFTEVEEIMRDQMLINKCCAHVGSL